MWNQKTATMIAILSLLIIGTIFNLSLVSCNGEGKQVMTKNRTLLSEAAIPAIDADAPMETETATFSLG